MTNEAKKSSGKVFDISSKVSASPTSRPVIVSHGPILHDPTIVAESGSEDKADKAPKEDKILSGPRQIVIKPLDDDLEPTAEKKEADAAKDETTAETKDEPEKTDEAKEATKEKAAETKEVKPAETTTDSDESKEESTPAPSSTPPQSELEQQKKEAAEAEAAIEHGRHIAELVASEQYFLPINQVKQRKNQRFLVIGGLVCVLLAVAWLDVALDAGLVSNSYHLPHTHFFAVKS